ncbi:MAG: thiol peroxidase [Flavobacteriales bacterium]|nr:thiol peroxidase [Flavobacteriia bacterium]NCP04762.1 thiol peroxidase [Flavobacteriales bacterium]PIV92650.1 MAG: thiol peroxidase [Flavobacteriaceae bacterium CG17_big_fil_post_rev_8_21_14_2_50_33_15]PIY11112.1 MAG: thiol peroxidase [Flavobacteriaceae bacterium CG_4_10_14_3_um_filter_33_47]PJB17797.1 MAG: thiol peroxidase [Flavobacteriaceae bacterium CG_4_9_14_3_um_filter_33_16]
MATVTLKGNEIKTSGNLPKIGSKAPEFKLTGTDLSTKTLKDFEGHQLVLNIFPSIDTGTCAQSVRQFNKEASTLKNTKVLCISRDLPFALSRFCGAEGLDNVINLSDYKDGSFGKTYGLDFITGPLEALNSRCVVIIDDKGMITYTEQVPEIVNEPNYEAALKALK